eukprot:GILK01009788.1.p1 GENE.GILK01009788.1~~GILK01009788.1.p1  ORF type:complete len:174 (-),score=10.88 GILK01009788.1:252-773(-)
MFLMKSLFFLSSSRCALRLSGVLPAVTRARSSVDSTPNGKFFQKSFFRGITSSRNLTMESAAFAMDEIPEGFRAYKRTPLFTVDNIPSLLLNRHNTKGGSWGKILVSKGSLEYVIFGPPERVFILTPDCSGIIKTREFHKVKLLSPDTEFHIEFYAANPDEAQAPKHVPTETI